MSCYRSYVVVLIVIGYSPGVPLSRAADPKPATEKEKSAAVTFETLKPVLQKRCASCHGGSEPKGGLVLTTLAGLKAGSESGPIVVSGKPQESMLYLVTAHLDGPKMPPG